MGELMLNTIVRVANDGWISVRFQGQSTQCALNVNNVAWHCSMHHASHSKCKWIKPESFGNISNVNVRIQIIQVESPKLSR